MATRRPNVPRATPAAPKAATPPADAGTGPAGDGGDVIRADFGGAKASAAKPPTSAGAAAPGAAKPGPRSPASGTPAPGKRRPAAAPGTRPAPGKAGGKPARRPAAGDAGDSLDPVPAKAFSGRLLALGVVMVAITILLAPTVKIFLDKRAEIAALQADIAAKQAKQEDLKRQVSRWQDPNYVKQQARDRINMVMPGETGYWVFGSDLPAAQASGSAGAATAQDPANLPWVDALWESIRRSATD
ncbi:septum formation initiator family protein [Arthrobacter sp. PM3]|uniref:FtsB family cell division protein n=1 Tax=Arthrobacter sp. PM3 TaxID=2017685 RepID=UPI000E1097E3|nr:septum formation initiator family protein [Arthrobacter sp. PM3]AXJ10335.1 septation ring formation regulator EzrA [Arthrobacter sp. PM3]